MHPPKVSPTSPTVTLGPASSAALAASTVRPSFSFANAASAKTAAVGRSDDQKATKEEATSVGDDAANQETSG